METAFLSYFCGMRYWSKSEVTTALKFTHTRLFVHLVEEVRVSRIIGVSGIIRRYLERVRHQTSSAWESMDYGFRVCSGESEMIGKLP